MQPADPQAEPWKQTTHLRGPGRGWEERVARGLGGGDRSKQGEKAKASTKAAAPVPQMDGPTMGLFYQVAYFEIILARKPLSLQNKIKPKKSLE